MPQSPKIQARIEVLQHCIGELQQKIKNCEHAAKMATNELFPVGSRPGGSHHQWPKYLRERYKLALADQIDRRRPHIERWRRKLATQRALLEKYLQNTCEGGGK
jgi:hypothetical protein